MHEAKQAAINGAFNAAVERYQAGNVRTAMLILQRLTLVAPTDVGVWCALARCHEELGEAEVADKLRWLGKALAEAVS